MGAPSPTEAVLTLGKYTLLEKLGEGYLGSVYRGFDQDLDRAVAVRILCEGIKWDSRIEELLDQQCRSIAALNHPGIASVFEAGKEGQFHFVVMESLGGSSLQSLIAQKPALTVEARVSIMMKVAEGLGHAHNSGILHRDLAPAKIHMTADGAAKIRDFAIAHVLRKHLPHPAVRWGAPIYLAPEQVHQKDCDPRSDIFSAGTIFYELLTYHHPFFDRDGNKALDNILLSTQIPTFERFPDVPPGIWPILKTCLEKDPKDRYRSVDEFTNACRDLLKDLAEDTRLMLAELYAALSPLKIAAAQPGAPGTIVLLLQDIQKLLRGEKQADYASLDRMMTVLLEQYPVIRAAAGALSTTDPTDMQFLPEEVKAACAEETGHDPLPAPVAVQELPPVGQALTEAGPQNVPAPATPGGIQPSSLLPEETDPNHHEFFDSSFAEAWDLSPALKSGPPPTTPEEKISKAPVAEPKPDVLQLAAAPIQDADNSAKTLDFRKPDAKPRYRRIPRPSYGAAAVLLALLIIAATVYIVWSSPVAASMGSVRHFQLLNSHPIDNIIAFLRGDRDGGTVSVASADVPKRRDSSQIFLAGLSGTDESGQMSPAGNAESAANQPSQESTTRISALINAGKLQPAKTELDTLQKAFPNSSRVSALRKQLQAKDSAAAQEQTLREQERLNAARRQKEDDWSSHLAELFSNGKYGEAESALSLWLSENPESYNAQQFETKLGDIQRNLKTYTAAMAENKYQDALNALGSAEKMNPADPNLAELRRQTETRKANARASLSIHRLGPKGVLFLDGRPISNDGEIENANIPIGSHLITIENGGTPLVSRRQEFLEGQRIALVHDLDRKYLRAMAETDRELVAQRKAMEEVRLFDVEHVHGTFRGSCRGILAVDYQDIAFKPSSGYHGFRMPFRLLKLIVNGKSVNLHNSSDDKLVQSFKLRNDQAAAKFKKSWDELKAFALQVAENK